MKKLNSLIAQMEEAMEQGWDDYANGITPGDEVYFIADEIKELGIGSVRIPTMQGRLKWFDLEEMTF